MDCHKFINEKNLKKPFKELNYYVKTYANNINYVVCLQIWEKLFYNHLEINIISYYKTNKILQPNSLNLRIIEYECK